MTSSCYLFIYAPMNARPLLIPISVSSRCPWLLVERGAELHMSPLHLSHLSAHFIGGLARNATIVIFGHANSSSEGRSLSTNSLVSSLLFSPPFDLQSLPGLPTFGSVFSALLSGAPLHARHRRRQCFSVALTKVGNIMLQLLFLLPFPQNMSLAFPSFQ